MGDAVDIHVTQAAADLARRKGGVLALDFIPPIG